MAREQRPHGLPLAKRVLNLRPARLAVTAIAGIVLVLGVTDAHRPPTAQGGTFAYTYIVDSTDDPGTGDFLCTLREAITATNLGTSTYQGCIGTLNQTDIYVINFALGPGTPAIDIESALPAIDKTTDIDGATGESTRVELHGPGLDLSITGLSIGPQAVGSQVSGLVINNFGGFGLNLGAANTMLRHSFVGTNAAGTAAVPNSQGVFVSGDSIRIGGTSGTGFDGPCEGDCNLISGNTLQGIFLDSGKNGVVVQGNYIGTDATGSAAIGNGTGIVNNATGALIGGTMLGAGNLMSGNTSLALEAAEVVTIQGNRIGTNRAGDSAIPNNIGLYIRFGAHNSLVGGTDVGAGNLISGNSDAGIFISDTHTITVHGNRIGTNAQGTGAVPNSTGIDISSPVGGFFIGGSSTGAGNVISGNAEAAISLHSTAGVSVQGNLIGTGPDGQTAVPNGTAYLATAEPLGTQIPGAIEILDAHSTIGGFETGSANTIAHNVGNGVLVSGQAAFYNFIYGNSIHSNGFKGVENMDGGNQEINSPVIISASSTGASGTISSPTCLCSVQVFSDSEDEGRVFEGSVIADMNGNWSFSGALEGPNVTALAYDDGGNTSEFSAPFDITPATPTPSPSPSPTPTPTPSPTPTATPTPTASPTPSPTGPVEQVAWGDHNCSGSADPIDGLLNLRHDAGLPAETNECPDMGEQVLVNGVQRLWGDFDCSGAADPVDGLKVLRFDAGLDVARPAECPDPGETVLLGTP